MFINKKSKTSIWRKNQLSKSLVKKLSNLTISISVIILFWGVNSLLYAQNIQEEEATTPPTSTTPNDNVIDIGEERIIIDDKLLEDNFYFDLDKNLNSEAAPLNSEVAPSPPANPPQKENKNYIQIQISNIVYPVTQGKEKRYIYITNTFIKNLTNVVFKTNEIENIVLNHQTNIVFKTNQIDEMKPGIPYIDLGYEFVRVRRMISRRQYEQALLLLSQLEIASPTNSRIYNMRGSIYYKLGFYNYAISNWEKSLTINPNQYLVKRYIDRLKVSPILQQNLNQSPR